MKECSKSIHRRLADSNFLRYYFVGAGIDIGGKPDPLVLYQELFPLLKSIKTWDWEDGDAQFMTGVCDETYDFVHSSHCLEHLVNPEVGMQNWFRIIKPGGYMVITVPDEDLYEQGIFPSTFNKDHKHTFTILKLKSWSDCSINIIDLIKKLGPAAELVKIEQLSESYRFKLPRYDQTLSPVGECCIEFVVRKRSVDEIAAGGYRKKRSEQPSKEIRLHLNQYQDDMKSMKQTNINTPPFKNKDEL